MGILKMKHNLLSLNQFFSELCQKDKSFQSVKKITQGSLFYFIFNEIIKKQENILTREKYQVKQNDIFEELSTELKTSLSEIDIVLDFDVHSFNFIFMLFYGKYLANNIDTSEEFQINNARIYSNLFDFFIDFGSFYKKHFLHDFQNTRRFEDFGFDKNLTSFNGVSFYQMFEDYQKQNINEENRFLFDFLPYFNK